MISLERQLKLTNLLVLKTGKVGCIFPMVISSEFRMGQYRDDDHREDAPHFMNPKAKPDRETIFWPVFLPEFLRVSLCSKNKDW